MADSMRYGTCTNRTHCSLAFNREAVLVPPDGNCPECGRPLKVSGIFSRIMKFLLLLLFLAALGAGGWYAKKTYIDSGQIDLKKLVSSVKIPPSTTPDASPANTKTEQDEPAPSDTPTPTARPVNDQARQDVLKRIDVMPHLTDQQREQLRDAVGRARNMGCIFIIPFQNNQRTLDANGINILANGFKSAAIQQLMQDATVVFVVLGYADKQGDMASNEKVSYERTQSVLNAMKDRCGVRNVTYGVAMGGSTMFDGKSTSKNRLVEIWAALP